MKKPRLISLLFSALLVWETSALASIVPPAGPGQIGYEAVVLCESLSVHLDRNGASKAVRQLPYGTLIAVGDMWDGWAECYLSETEGKAGWVRSDYLAVNPAFYMCDEATAVYAWDDGLAPKIALLKKGARLPILRDQGDWLTVSLRAAAGCIHKTALDSTDADTLKKVSGIGPINKATLKTPKGEHALLDTAKLQWLRQRFSGAQPIMPSACPFDATLTLSMKDGAEMTFALATDSCPVFRTADGSYFNYKDHEKTRSDDSASDTAQQFWALFGLDMNALY